MNRLESLVARTRITPQPLSHAAGAPALLAACGLTLDVGRQRVTPDDLGLLHDIAEAAGVIPAHAAMMAGDLVNRSEIRPALHTLLRADRHEHPGFDEVKFTQARMSTFARAVRGGDWRGATGEAITDVINVGIGGSDAGPRLVVSALASQHAGPKVHFVSNVDGGALARLLPQLDARRTLAIVSSKSFSTRETLLNARAIQAWFDAAGIDAAGLAQHMVAVSARPDAAQLLGLPYDRQFSLWDWVGGRFSLWSAIGLPVMLACGPAVFDELLAGARAMDQHSLETRLGANLPANLAMFAAWNSIALKATTHCLLPYDDRLGPMIPWLQQLEMESLGKSRRIDGKMALYPTGQAVWGGVGTDAQHTFFQWLRQGTGRTSVDILWAEQHEHDYPEHHASLLANARAQADALVLPDADSQAVNAVSTIAIDRLTPARLGALLALYEHKTTMLATILGINAFDQPGVELGKQLARKLEGL